MAAHDYANSVYAATYSGIQVYEMICRGIAVMRRYSDSWLNATQILKVAGVEKGRRTKILEREVLTGVHEKIQGGYGKYQGTWVPFTRGVQLCQQYSVYDYVRPILDHDPTESGTRPDKTPTKAEMRRLMKSSQKPATPSTSMKRECNSGSRTEPKRYRMASSAATSPLNSDAMSAYQPNTAGHGVPSTPGFLHEEPPGPVPRMVSSATPFRQSLYSSPTVSYGGKTPVTPSVTAPASTWRPRLDSGKASSQTLSGLDTEPLGNDTHAKHDRMLLMDIFLKDDAEFIPEWLVQDDSDKNTHQVDVGLVIDDQGHTAVHWAAALARIHILDLLLLRDADARRLNYEGESALVRAVQVTNNYENQTFPDLLELLHDTIPLTDKCNRTVLHHIALAAGSEGRERAARYYADCLLSWIVRLAGGYQVDASEDATDGTISSRQLDSGTESGQGAAGATAKTLPTPTQSSSPNERRIALGGALGSPQTNGAKDSFAEEPVSTAAAAGTDTAAPNADFAAFLNLQDVHGDTALSIAAQGGDRAMIRMLLNAGASTTISNRVGLCPLDFRVDQLVAAADDVDGYAAGDMTYDDGASGLASGRVPDAIASPTPSGRMRKRALSRTASSSGNAQLPQTPLRSAMRGANKNLLSSLVGRGSASSPARGRAQNGTEDDDLGSAGDIWSPASAEQRMHQSVASIRQLMSELESDFTGEIKSKREHFDAIKQQLRSTTIELAKARETIYRLRAKTAQLSDIKSRVDFLEETLARETSAVREAISALPCGSKPREDLEAMLESLLEMPSAESDDGTDLPPVSAVGGSAKPGDEDGDELEDDPAKLRAAVERLRTANEVYARRDALLRERVTALRKRAEVSERERQYRQIIASCCEISEDDVDVWIDKLVSAVEANGSDADAAHLPQANGTAPAPGSQADPSELAA
ncbi:transcriptional regulator swi6 [Coemansia sp. RSA 552]|nr:transcriptional regulator swi6 [Coemansia sp. RSA 552]